PSQATIVSGSTRVIEISPNSPRRRARDSGSLTSAQSSGWDLTSRRLTCTGIGSSFACRYATPSGLHLTQQSVNLPVPGDAAIDRHVDQPAEQRIGPPARRRNRPRRPAGDAVGDHLARLLRRDPPAQRRRQLLHALHGERVLVDV